MIATPVSKGAIAAAVEVERRDVLYGACMLACHLPAHTHECGGVGRGSVTPALAGRNCSGRDPMRVLFRIVLTASSGAGCARRNATSHMIYLSDWVWNCAWH